MVDHDPGKRPNATEIKNWLKFHLLNLSPTEACSPIVSNRFDHLKSNSTDSNLLPVKKGLRRFQNEEERLLNKTQSCM